MFERHYDIKSYHVKGIGNDMLDNQEKTGPLSYLNKSRAIEQSCICYARTLSGFVEIGR